MFANVNSWCVGSPECWLPVTLDEAESEVAETSKIC